MRRLRVSEKERKLLVLQKQKSPSRKTHNLTCISRSDNVVASNANGSSKSAAFSPIPALLLRNSRTIGEGGTRVASSAGTPTLPTVTSPTSSYTHSDPPREL